MIWSNKNKKGNGMDKGYYHKIADTPQTKLFYFTWYIRFQRACVGCPFRGFNMVSNRSNYPEYTIWIQTLRAIKPSGADWLANFQNIWVQKGAVVSVCVRGLEWATMSYLNMEKKGESGATPEWVLFTSPFSPCASIRPVCLRSRDDQNPSNALHFFPRTR